jgi:hypothetical protein
MITLKSQLNRPFDKPHFEDIVKDLHKLNQQILSFSNGNGFNLMLESTVNQTTSGTVFFSFFWYDIYSRRSRPLLYKF